MNLDELQRKLIASARANPPSDRVPFAFEQRIMHVLRSCPAPDAWALWGRALWRAAAPCVAIMLLLGAWAWLSPTGTTSGTDLSQDLATTLFAASDQEPSADSFQ